MDLSRKIHFLFDPRYFEDVLLVSMGFPTANVLRQFSGQEITKIDDLKTSERVLGRFHFSGER